MPTRDNLVPMLTRNSPVPILYINDKKITGLRTVNISPSKGKKCELVYAYKSNPKWYALKVWIFIGMTHKGRWRYRCYTNRKFIPPKRK